MPNYIMFASKILFQIWMYLLKRIIFLTKGKILGWPSLIGLVFDYDVEH